MKPSRHPARVTSSLARCAALLALTLALCACETTGFSSWGSREPDETRAERLALNGEHAEAAAVYIGLAADAGGMNRDRLTLLAVEQWLDARDVARARNAFASILPPKDTELRQLWSTNSAALSLYRGDPDAALGILEPMSREPLSL